jgi:uncharacterized hydrophobic protein (TIGR00341 family)
MALKMVRAHVSADRAQDAEAAIRDVSSHTWIEAGGRYGAIVNAILGSERSGEALDRLHEKLSGTGELLVLVQPLDGVLPRPFATSDREARNQARSAAAVSREEVYANIADTARFNRNYAALVVLASVVAAIGLARDNTAAVIGAMVVAPLLGPNMALALGIVLGDGSLVRRALSTNLLGLAVALVSAALLGLALDADPSTPELASRTRVGIWDLALALAAGCAGALAYTTGIPTYLTGVMVAVALLPPAVASGMLLSVGETSGAFAALLLAGGNVTALTLAAMLTFLWRGMTPRNWWQEEQARRSARRGVAVYAALVLAADI